MNTVMITRVAETQWQAVADDCVVGSGDLSQRPDGRLFLSIDAWQSEVFDRLAATILPDLPKPLYTVVGEADHELTAGWEQFGFTVGRREREYVVPTDVRGSGFDPLEPPADVTIVPVGEADEILLRALDHAIREEVEAAVGWASMPAEVLPRPAGTTLVDPSKYAVAVRNGRYVGLVRIRPMRRQARIGLIAVRADQHRQGIGRALLAHALGSLHHAGVESAWAEVDESNAAAIALFEGLGARRTGGNLELVCR